MRGQADTQTDIATYRLNWPMSQFSENAHGCPCFIVDLQQWQPLLKYPEGIPDLQWEYPALCQGPLMLSTDTCAQHVWPSFLCSVHCAVYSAFLQCAVCRVHFQSVVYNMECVQYRVWSRAQCLHCTHCAVLCAVYSPPQCVHYRVWCFRTKYTGSSDSTATR